jgi:hypothetical protein
MQFRDLTISRERRPVKDVMQRSQGNGNGRPDVPESVWSALVHVYDTGQRLVLERIELAKLEILGFARVELQAMARQIARNMVLALAGGIMLIAGWFVLSWGLVNLAASSLSMAWRLLIEAALNLSIGGWLIRLASRDAPPIAVTASAMPAVNAIAPASPAPALSATTATAATASASPIEKIGS